MGQRIKVVVADEMSLIRYGVRAALADLEDIALAGEAAGGEWCIWPKRQGILHKKATGIGHFGYCEAVPLPL